MGIFSKFKAGLKKTAESIATVGGLFGSRKLSAEDLDELEEALYQADIGVETTEEILQEIQQAVRKQKELRGQEAAAIGTAVLKRVLEGAEGRIDSFTHQPEVITLIGVNGSGKTTTTAKLGKLWQDAGKKPLIGACDTFRAAANEQLHAWCQRLGLDLIASQQGADAAAVAFDAYESAKARQADVLLLDTAGRLHTKENLMKELAKVRRVLQKHDESAPHHAWLVIDGTNGSNAIEQARVFHREFGLTGLIITKLDGTSRGGALVGIYRELRLPIYFVGLGEQPDDLQPFTIDDYTQALFAPGE